MTPEERRLTAALLRMAADQFSNHGCNDFDLSSYVMNASDRDALVIESCGELYGDGRTEPDYRLGDSELMDLMADRLDNSSKL